MTRTKITSPQMAPKKSTDANGWTVYDYGTWKQYRKKGSTGFTIAGGGWSGLAGSGNLPVGMSTIGTRFVEGAVGCPDTAVLASIVARSTDNSVSIAINNQYGGSVSNSVHWSFCITEV